MKKIGTFFLFLCSVCAAWGQSTASVTARDSHNATTSKLERSVVLYGTASYYADKFEGRPTATGVPYNHSKLTAACNQLPLGTWIRVTNLRNNKTVVVQVNDRLHPKNKRVVDMSKMGAKQLGYISRGLTQVKVEVLAKTKATKRLISKG